MFHLIVPDILVVLLSPQLCNLSEEPLEVSYSLVELNLSNNNIQQFPTWLGQYIPALVTLSLAR